jgi:hypothetical protein
LSGGFFGGKEVVLDGILRRVLFVHYVKLLAARTEVRGTTYT